MAETSKAPAPRPISVDESRAHCAYANFCRVTGSPEELIIDFGLNAQPLVGRHRQKGRLPTQCFDCLHALVAAFLAPPSDNDLRPRLR